MFLYDEIHDMLANIIIAQFLFLESEDPDKEIMVYINSPGGVVTSGLAIHDTMQYVRCDVSTTCLGMAASMAAVLLAAGTKGRRNALPNARIMIHQPMGGARGQASDIEIQAREIRHLKEVLTDILTNATGKTKEQILKDIDRDFYLSAAAAKEYGLIDNVMLPPKKQSDGTQGEVELTGCGHVRRLGVGTRSSCARRARTSAPRTDADVSTTSQRTSLRCASGE